ncbi:MAG: D-amino-acid dehydrogenase [Polaromonas sp.]|nr:D-amino-acid dehydrogenase [Polaromonas sp.]
MHVLILGSGLLGVNSAWYLSQLGHEVTVVDRQAAVAAETSHANGGQRSVGHAESWADPSAPFKMLKWLARKDAPLLFRLRADPHQWAWGLKFLRECTPARDAALEPTRQMRELEPTCQMRELGCDRQLVSAKEAVRIEPALRTVQNRLAGAAFTAEDESGDARKFTLELARRCEARGGKFLMSHHIARIVKDGERVSHVEVTDPEGRYLRLNAESYVCWRPAASAPCWRGLWASTCPFILPRAIRSRCR